MALTANAQKVLEVLYFKRKFEPDGGWMEPIEISELCGFEKRGTATGSLIGLQKRGLVEYQTQELLNGKVFRFFRIANPLPNGVEINVSADIIFQE